MKKVFYTQTIVLALFFVLTLISCSKTPTSTQENAKDIYIDATSKDTWKYYSFSTNKIVGSGEETIADNEKWYARKDWDIAIKKYNIRTNSGSATTIGAKGGVYTCDTSVLFDNLKELPVEPKFVEDTAITSAGMGGDITTVCSKATVIKFKTKDDGSMIMPPVYLQTPVYIFRTADGQGYFKVKFTQYQDENKVSGNVKFSSAQMK